MNKKYVILVMLCVVAWHGRLACRPLTSRQRRHAITKLAHEIAKAQHEFAYATDLVIQRHALRTFNTKGEELRQLVPNGVEMYKWINRASAQLERAQARAGQ
jgi:hypothetical protein